MKLKYTLLFFAAFALSSRAQLNVSPSTINTGSNTMVVFSGSPITISNGSCIEVILTSTGTQIFSNGYAYYSQASNVVITWFDIASNTIVGAYNVVLRNWCTGATIGTYASKLTIAKAAISNLIKELFNFEIFPNPIQSGQNLHVWSTQLHGKPNSLTIYDMSGKTVFHRDNVQKEDVVPTDILQKGIYYIHAVNAKGESYSKKLEVE